MTEQTILDRCASGRWGGHVRGLEYFSTFDETFIKVDKNLTIRVRDILLVHSQFKTFHTRYMVQYQEKYITGGY